MLSRQEAQISASLAWPLVFRSMTITKRSGCRSPRGTEQRLWAAQGFFMKRHRNAVRLADEHEDEEVREFLVGIREARPIILSWLLTRSRRTSNNSDTLQSPTSRTTEQ